MDRSGGQHCQTGPAPRAAYPPLAAAGQALLHQSGIWHIQGNREPVGAEVNEPVAQRQVQELRLPRRQPQLGRRRSALPSQRVTSGTTLACRAKRISRANRNLASSSGSVGWLAPITTAVRNEGARVLAALVVSHAHRSPVATRLAAARPSSPTSEGRVVSVSYTPAQACPSWIRTSGFNPACSKHATNSMVKSRQVATPPSTMRSGVRIF